MPQIEVLCIPPGDGPAQVIRLPKQNPLAALQEAVGGWIEAIETPTALFLVNEEGKLHGLGDNPNATALLQLLGIDLAMYGDHLVGPAVVATAVGSEIGPVSPEAVVLYRNQIGSVSGPED